MSDFDPNCIGQQGNVVSRKRLVLNTTFEVATGQIKQDPITFAIDGSAIFWTTDWPN